MAAWGTVWKKEVKETLRDFRVLAPALLVGPILSPMLLGFMISIILEQAVEQKEKPLPLHVIGAEHAPNLIQYLEKQRIVVEAGPVDQEAALRAVRGRQHEVVLIIHPEIKSQVTEGKTATLGLVFDRGRRSSITQSNRIIGLLQGYSAQLGALRLFARGIDPRIIQPINVDRIDVSTPSARSVVLLGFLTYVMLFAVLMGGLSIINDATAGERERKSLEPLLTTPVSRSQLVIEKILSAAFFMVIALILCLTVLMLGLGRLPLEQLGMRSNFGLPQAAFAFAILLPFVLLGAGAMCVVSSFTKTYKEAQTYLGLGVLIPTLPIMFASIADLKARLSLMFVPSLSQHFLLQSALKDEPLDPLHIVISVTSTLVLAALTIFLATRLYQREGILG